MMQTPDLQETTALVTGASRGLGRAFALNLAQRGAAVGLLARNGGELREAAKEIHSAGGRALVLTADVTDVEAVRRAVSRLREAFGPVNLLVNAAGACLSAIGETWNIHIDDWWRVFEINVKGSQICYKAVIRDMLRDGNGRIIHIASSTVLHDRPYMSAYVASKSALIKLAEVEAEELKGTGVAVFAVHPGTVLTPLSEGLIASGRFPWLADIFKQGKGNTSKQGCELIAYLASGSADVLSGCFFPVPLSPETLVQFAPQILKERLHVLRALFLQEALNELAPGDAPSLGV